MAGPARVRSDRATGADRNTAVSDIGCPVPGSRAGGAGRSRHRCGPRCGLRVDAGLLRLRRVADGGHPVGVRHRACGANPVALVVPCHRLVRADGSTAGYRWGEERKQELLAAENSHVRDQA
ncbi:MAG: MGMT family protein [Acidimicrobiia bacterium]|nr:MGMT family protein [Acidimicrobiia bacterium]